MNPSYRATLFLSGLLVLSFAPSAPANPTFTKLADSDTPLPGGVGTFTFFGRPALHGKNVAFAGQALFGSIIKPIGIYKWVEGTLIRVADRDTSIPGGTGTFDDFSSSVSISGGTVAFQGSDSAGQAGIYTDSNGLQVIADTSVSIPNGSGSFTGFSSPWLKNDLVVFAAEGASGWEGIYLHDGSLHCVADANTPIPPDGGDDYALLRGPVLGGGLIAFKGYAGDNSPTGIYRDDAGTPICVADNNTPVPGGSGTFNTFGWGSLSIADNGDVALAAIGSSYQCGVYTYIDGQLERLVDKTSSLPGYQSQVTNFGGTGIDGGNVAFTIGCCVVPPPVNGLPIGVYLNIDGELCRIVTAGDTLDGKTVHQVATGRQCLSGNRIAFWASYNNGLDEGIYVAEFYPGDLDGDRDVDLSDLAKLLGHYGETGVPRTDGDINGDRQVSTEDLRILLMNYGTTWPE